MKNFFCAVVLFLSATVSAQSFVIPFEVGQGFKFKDYKNPQYYLVSTSVKPAMETVNNKLIISSIITTTFSNGETDVFAGTGISYKVFQKDSSFNIQLGGNILYGTNQRKLFGGNLTFEFDETFYLNLNIRQEYSQKELWLDGGVGVNLFQSKSAKTK